jgi:hypothetical protein
MTKFVSIIGNGESRFGFDLVPLKKFSTVIGCNAQFRDYNFDYFVVPIVIYVKKLPTQWVRIPHIHKTEMALRICHVAKC